MRGKHKVVSHGVDEYILGDAHINGMEGFWSFVKENMTKHHSVSPSKFLLYIKEME